jgi:hypothetical protein
MTMTIVTNMPSALTVTQGAETLAAVAEIKEKHPQLEDVFNLQGKIGDICICLSPLLLTDVFTKYM